MCRDALTAVHVIPKPNADEGLVVGWPAKPADKDELKKVRVIACTCSR